MLATPAIAFSGVQNPGELRRLVDYWSSGYDWRRHEAAINALPSRFADIRRPAAHPPERAQGLAPRLDRVEVPTALAIFPADLGLPAPRSWVERKYHLARCTRMARGGHFPAHEEPALLAADITAFFGDLRNPVK